jgi:CRISPR/Cas system-associated exonuclease Cas4 (RecB family)
MLLGEAHAALSFGEAIHAALPITLTEGYERGLAEFNSIWGHREADEKRNNVTAARILADYAAAQSQRPYRLIKPDTAIKISNKVSEWEIPFAIDIGMHVPLVGRIDGLCRMNHDDSLWVLEYKTSSELTARTFTSWELSPQVICYVSYLRATVDEPIQGAMIEVVRVSARDSLTLSNPVWVKDHHVDNFILWARKMAAEIKWCEDNRCFPPHYSGCHPYAHFGQHGYLCSYSTLCQLPDEHAAGMRSIMSFQEPRPYDALLAPKELPQCLQASTHSSIPQLLSKDQAQSSPTAPTSNISSKTSSPQNNLVLGPSTTPSPTFVPL